MNYPINLFRLVDYPLISGLTLAVGLWVARSAGRSTTDFFLSGRDMPWWLLGISMVATTFSAYTPNLVTDIVRTNGVAGNWVWWAFLLTGMLTVFARELESPSFLPAMAFIKKNISPLSSLLIII